MLDIFKGGLKCPECKKGTELIVGDHSLTCSLCNATYPVYHNIPVLINEKESIFTHEDFRQAKNLFFDISKKGKIKSVVAKIIPSINTSNSSKNFAFFKKTLVSSSATKPKVLILGGSVLGTGIKELINSPEIDFLESDVSFGPRTQLVLDGHTIPFKDNYFDGIIAQAVLEHVVDPAQCVSEMFRVLKPSGIVYSEIPFMQQVHGGAYDFTRYTLSGHKRLFRHFEVLKCGSVAGSGSAMAWAYQYLLLGLFGHTNALRYITKTFARLTGFWLKYLDYVELLNSHKNDGASGTYFIGSKSDKIVSDIEIINSYS